MRGNKLNCFMHCYVKRVMVTFMTLTTEQNYKLKKNKITPSMPLLDSMHFNGINMNSCNANIMYNY